MATLLHFFLTVSSRFQPSSSKRRACSQAKAQLILIDVQMPTQKRSFFHELGLLCSLREEFLTCQTNVSKVGCGFDCLKERAGLIKMEGQPSKCQGSKSYPPCILICNPSALYFQVMLTMSIIQRTAFHANMKSCPVRYERQHKSFTDIEHHIGVAGRLHSSLLRIYFPGFTVRIPVHTAKRSGRIKSDM